MLQPDLVLLTTHRLFNLISRTISSIPIKYLISRQRIVLFDRHGYSEHVPFHLIDVYLGLYSVFNWYG